MFQYRLILMLFLCLPIILKADYGVEIVTKIEGSDCKIEMTVFLYGDSECVSDYNVTVLVDGQDVTPAPPAGGWTTGYHRVEFSEEGMYEVIISDNVTEDNEPACAFTYEKDVICSCEQVSTNFLIKKCFRTALAILGNTNLNSVKNNGMFDDRRSEFALV